MAESKFYYPQDFNLESVDIITDTGKVYKLKELVMELSFFEDIYSFACSGQVVLRDAVGIIEGLQLDGSEYIKIGFSKSKSEDVSDKNIRTYRLYKVGIRKPAGNKSTEFYTMYFCAEELLLSEQLKISKSYKGMSVSNIINSILLDEENGLNVPYSRIKEIQDTYGVYDFIVPKLKPFEAISWLSTYARPNDNGGADMVFFETNDGYYFKSIQSMFDQRPLTTYSYQPSNLNFKNKAENAFNIIDYEFVKTYDSLKATSAGIYASRLVTIDPLTRKKTVTDFSKDNLDGYSASGSPMNRFGKKQTEMFESSFKLAFSNSNQKNNEYINQSQSDVSKDVFVETYVPSRTAQMALSNYTVMKAIIPGDSFITAGKTVNIEINSMSTQGDAQNQQKKLDEYASGVYLITAVRHIIQTQGVYQTVLELAKQSLKQSYKTQSTTYSGYLDA